MISQIELLPQSVTASIKEFIFQKEISTSPLIRDDIFNILEEHCTVLYFPLEDENDGCHVKRFVKNQLFNFVYINTQSQKIELKPLFLENKRFVREKNN